MHICLGEGHRGWYLSNLEQFEVSPKKTSWREGGINIESGWRTPPPQPLTSLPESGVKKGAAVGGSISCPSEEPQSEGPSKGISQESHGESHIAGNTSAYRSIRI